MTRFLKIPQEVPTNEMKLKIFKYLRTVYTKHRKYYSNNTDLKTLQNANTELNIFLEFITVLSFTKSSIFPYLKKDFKFNKTYEKYIVWTYSYFLQDVRDKVSMRAYVKLQELKKMTASEFKFNNIILNWYDDHLLWLNKEIKNRTSAGKK